MRLKVFGFELALRKAIPPLRTIEDGRGGRWWPFGIIRERFPGDWQRDIEWSTDTVLAHHAVYACVALISNDVGKLRPKLMEYDTTDTIWTEVTAPSPFHKVLRRPNHFQNYFQFKAWWLTSKLLRGNTYVLKRRDNRKVVDALYVLDPQRVQVLMAQDGSIFYKLSADNIIGLTEMDMTVPASEIIHDRMNCLFHPLVGISPLYACGLAASMGLRIQENAAHFFQNGSNPGGVLTAPATIPQATADRIKLHWDTEYSGENSGKVAVLGDGLKFEPMRMSNEDSQMIEQLKYTAEMVCSAFNVPPFKIGVGQPPTYNNAEILNQVYYSDCLQAHIESHELCMDDGLNLGPEYPKEGGKVLGVELDLDALLRMDSATQMKTIGEGVKAGVLSPNEGRRKLDKPPTVGGESPYLQQQNYSLAALAKRDAKEDPFATASSASAAPATPEEGEDEDQEGDDAATAAAEEEAEDMQRGLQLAAVGFNSQLQHDSVIRGLRAWMPQ